MAGVALTMTTEPFDDDQRFGRRALLGGSAALAAGAVLGAGLSGSAVASDVGVDETLVPEGLAVEAGACTYLPLDPFRLADTRPDRPQKDFVPHQWGSTRLIQVPIRGRGGAPLNARAAVLTVTAINRWRPAFVTVFPWGQPRPDASNINLPGVLNETISNLVTVQLGNDGSVGIYVEGAADLIVDLSGVYVPATGPSRAGRMEIRPSSVRILDTRSRGFKVGANTDAQVFLPTQFVPAHATAAVVNLTVTQPDALGFFTAYPFGIKRPDASNLNVSGPGDGRAIGAIVKIGTDSRGRRGFNVYSSHGSHLIVDLAGYVTGAAAASSTNGLFVPHAPLRRLDTRRPGGMGRLWPGWTVEFGVPSSYAAKAQAIAMNLTTSRARDAGFLTAYAAGTPRPDTSNLNPRYVDHTVANHVITRISNRGVAVYHARGGSVICDLAGYFTGTPTRATLPPPVNPDPPPVQLPYRVRIPRLRVNAWVFGGADSNAVVDAGHVWHWSGTGLLGQNTNMVLFAHRTEANALLRYQHNLRVGDELLLSGNDGRTFRYVMGYDYVTNNRPTNILAATRFWPGPTVSLVSCTKPNKLPTDLKYRLITTFRLDRWWEA